MTPAEWEKRIGEFIGEIAADDNLSDDAYVEVLQDVVSLAEASIEAKQAEMRDEDEEDEDEEDEDDDDEDDEDDDEDEDDEDDEEIDA